MAMAQTEAVRATRCFSNVGEDEGSPISPNGDIHITNRLDGNSENGDMDITVGVISLKMSTTDSSAGKRAVKSISCSLFRRE
jgi:predicted phage tail protein